MNIHERRRMTKNEKVKQFSDKVLKVCKEHKFSVADMKDLAEILPHEISKAIISLEEECLF